MSKHWSIDPANPTFIYVTGTQPYHYVCRVEPEDFSVSAWCDDDKLHHARLIAAAPALLEALLQTTASLEAAISLLGRGSKKAAPSDMMFDMMLADYRGATDQARAVIAAATGEKP